MVAIVLRRLVLYPRGESNPNRRNRNPKFYPLNYGDIDKRQTLVCIAKLTLLPQFSKKTFSVACGAMQTPRHIDAADI